MLFRSDQAIGRLRRALNEYFVGGIETNISLFRRILTDPDFRAAKMDTGFLDRLLNEAAEIRVAFNAIERLLLTDRAARSRRAQMLQSSPG